MYRTDQQNHNLQTALTCKLISNKKRKHLNEKGVKKVHICGLYGYMWVCGNKAGILRQNISVLETAAEPETTSEDDVLHL